MNDIRDRMLALIPNLGVFAVVLAIGVSLLGSFTAPKPGDKKGGEPAKAADSPPPLPPPVAGTPLPPHVRFLQAISLYPTDNQVAQSTSRRDSLRQLGKEAEADTVDERAGYRERCEYLIVTVPDPIETQFGFWFDQCVEAVQMAMSAAGHFTLEHSWYPWRAGKGKKADEYGPADHQKHPGVIVFRDSRKWDRKRVVLLVGENPVTGVHKSAMSEALQLAERMDQTCTPAAAVTPQAVRVVGPFFSGSQPSFVEAVNAWTGGRLLNRVRVNAISGSATGLAQPCDPVVWEWKSMLPTLRQEQVYRQRCTRASNEAARKAVLYYLAEREGAKSDFPFRKKVATGDQMAPASPEGLADSDTSARQVEPPPLDGVAYLIEANSGFGEGAARDVASSLVLRFPLHLSKLAGLQSKERRERDERLGLAPTGGGKLTALDETRSGADSLPAADESRTALLNQTLLADHWAHLRREKVKYVGLIATDPRDKIFLIEQMREHVPDVVPFVFGHDQHYSNPEYAPFLRGTLVAGTNSLYPPAQDWTNRNPIDHRRLAFASTHAEGVYNATVILFQHEDQLLDYHPPHWGPPGNGRPPIWVSVVAEDGKLIPLAYFTNYNDDIVYSSHFPAAVSAFTGSAATMLAPYSPPVPVAVWVWATAILIAAVYAGYLFVRHIRLWTASTRNLIRLNTAGAWAAAGLVVGAGTLAVYVVAVERHFPAVVQQHPLGWLVTKISLVVSAVPTVIFTGVVAYAFLRLPFRWLPARWAINKLLKLVGRKLSMAVSATERQTETEVRWRPTWWEQAAAAVYAVVVLGGSVALVWLVAGQVGSLDDSQRGLFLERAGWVARGSSVLVPAVLLASGFFAFGARRLSAAASLAAPYAGSPYPDGTADATFGEQFDHIHDQARRLDGTVFDLGYMLRRNWAWKVLLAVGVIAAAVFLYLRGHRTWEGAAWDWLFGVGFLVLAGLALRSAVRLFAAWQVLERMLRTVARLPMVGAFDRMPDKVVRMLAGFLLTTNPRRGDLAICHHLLRQLRAAVAEKPDGFRPDIVPPLPSPVLDDPLFIWDDPSKPGSPYDQGKERQRELSDAQRQKLMAYSRELVVRLMPDWKSATVLEAFGKRAGKDPGETDLKIDEGWKKIAEQFVAIQVVMYLSQFFARLRHLATSGVVTSALLLVAVTAYPFQPEQPIMAAAVVVAVAVTFAVMWVFYRMNRNEIVSRLSHTTPDKFTLDGKFLTSMVQFAVPLVLLMVAQLSGRLRTLFEPVLELFR